MTSQQTHSVLAVAGNTYREMLSRAEEMGKHVHPRSSRELKGNADKMQANRKSSMPGIHFKKKAQRTTKPCKSPNPEGLRPSSRRVSSLLVQAFPASKRRHTRSRGFCLLALFVLPPSQGPRRTRPSQKTKKKKDRDTSCALLQGLQGQRPSGARAACVSSRVTA